MSASHPGFLHLSPKVGPTGFLGGNQIIGLESRTTGAYPELRSCLLVNFYNPPWTSISSLFLPTFSMEGRENKRSKEVGTQAEKVRRLFWESGEWEGKDRAPFL